MTGLILNHRFAVGKATSSDGIFDSFSATDTASGRDRTVRLLRPEFSGLTTFHAEVAQVINRYDIIDHPGVEKLLEVGADQEQLYLVSELSDGVPIAERIKKLAPFSVPVGVSTAISLCQALEAIHHAGLVHGDINSSTVLALPDGQVKLQLAGFWSAYAAQPALATAALQSIAPYLAPEVSAGSLPSPQADMYSVGVLLYQLLTGRLPYNADSSGAMAIKHATAAVPTTKLFNQAVPGVLDEIVKKALAKDPADRYVDAGDMLADLQILQDALRFGKTITWPLRQAPERPSQMPKQVVSTKQAPAVQKKAVEPRVRRQREPADVPLFMVILLSVFSAIVLTMLGIWIAFSYSRPTLITVPAIKDLTVEDATVALRKVKLQLRVTGEKANDRIEAGHIASSEPPGGDQLRENGTVFVTVSSGSRYVKVPNLRGSTVEEARSLLRAVRLDLDDQIVQRESPNLESGKIISQDPAPNSKDIKSVLEQGSRVKVIVSSGISENATTPTISSSTNLYTLKVKLTGLEEPVTLRVDIEDERGLRTVYEQDHPPETTVNLNVRGTGEKVKFYIYYDNELVREVEQNASQAAPVRGNSDR